MLKIILITGAPGVGKSAIMEELRVHFPKGFFVDVDIFRTFVGVVNLQDHDRDYEETWKVLERLIVSLWKNDYFAPIFIFDCLTPKRLFDVVERISKTCEIKSCVLWEENSLLEERMSARQGHFYDDIENAIKINNWFLELKNKDGVVFVDRTELDVKKTVKEILKRV